MHTTWPGDVHTLLLGAGSFVALMVVSCTPHGRVMHIHCYLVLAHSSFDGVDYNHSTTWQGDAHTLLLGAGSFVALMVAVCTPTWPGDAHTLLLGAGSFVALMVVYAHTTWPGDVHTLLLGAGSFVALMVVYAHHMAG